MTPTRKLERLIETLEGVQERASELARAFQIADDAFRSSRSMKRYNVRADAETAWKATLAHCDRLHKSIEQTERQIERDAKAAAKRAERDRQPELFA